MSFFHEDYRSSFYRSRDDISNFKIRVSIGKIETSLKIFDMDKDALNNKNFDVNNFEEQYTFNWQERVFCQRELETYHNSNNDSGDYKLNYHRLSTLQKGNSGKKDTRLFSYVHSDHFIENNLDLCTTKDESTTVSSESKFLRQKGITMLIMADLSPFTSVSKKEDEKVLCTLKYYPASGLLHVKPDFNWSNKPYLVTNEKLRGHETFKYVLEHVSSKPTREEQENEYAMFREMYQRRQTLLLSSVGNQFEKPANDSIRLVINGEIVSAKNFPADQLHVNWFIDLPEGWSCNSLKFSFGSTQTCLTKTVRLSKEVHFSYLFSLDLVCNIKQLLENIQADTYSHVSNKWPMMFFEVMSVDSWSRYRTEGYSNLRLPKSPGVKKCRLNCWRPVGNGNSVLANLKRYFIGNCSDMSDISTYSVIKDGNLCKFGLKTVSTGTIFIRTYTVMQYEAFSENNLSFANLSLNNENFKMKMNSNVSKAVIDSFLRAKQRIKLTRENLKLTDMTFE